MQHIRAITLPMPFRMGSVNCYLVQAGEAYALIDTGAPNARRILTAEMRNLGCRPGTLKLILLTHGDFDHIGNAAHVRAEFGGKIAMHPNDAGMAEVGDMFVNRERASRLVRALAPRLIGFGKAERFAPDALLGDGSTLSEYGLDAQVVWIPGHSSGSIGVLTRDGELFCGDLFHSTKKPALNGLIDNRDTALRSVAKLRSLKIGMVYPGHGEPFSMDELSGESI